MTTTNGNGEAAKAYSKICDEWQKRGDEIELLREQKKALEDERDSLRNVLAALARVLGVAQIEKEFAQRESTRTSLLFLQESRKVSRMRDERDASFDLKTVAPAKTSKKKTSKTNTKARRK